MVGVRTDTQAVRHYGVEGADEVVARDGDQCAEVHQRADDRNSEHNLLCEEEATHATREDDGPNDLETGADQERRPFSGEIGSEALETGIVREDAGRRHGRRDADLRDVVRAERAVEDPSRRFAKAERERERRPHAARAEHVDAARAGYGDRPADHPAADEQHREAGDQRGEIEVAPRVGRGAEVEEERQPESDADEPDVED